ncbi:MAG: rhodanese-like domain-containing protein [Candidatus Poseidoniaceae archaeon]
MFKILKSIFSRNKVNISELIENGALVIDVRSPAEFKSGHWKGAQNIPLQDIQTKLNSLKKKSVPIVACCASGMRSGKAVKIMNSNGIEAYNAGSWRNL